MHVLIADDRVEDRQFLETFFRERGVNVTAAYSGYHALNELGHDPSFDVVILNWMMADLDGCEIARRVRGQDIYVILMVGEYFRDQVQECLKSVADEFMSKPFDLVRLDERIQKFKRDEEAISELIRKSKAEDTTAFRFKPNFYGHDTDSI